MKKQHLNISEPPENGELNFSFDIEPVSLESNSSKIEFLQREIRKITSSLNYLLTGDLRIEFKWEAHRQERYENVNSPGIDNLVNVVLNALSGSHGVIVSDCQIKSISKHCIDSKRNSHKIDISIKYNPEESTSKENLVFVHLGKDLYFPMLSHLPLPLKQMITDQLERTFSLREKISPEEMDYHQANDDIPVQRVFHKSRVVDNFETMEINEYLAQ